MRQTAVFAFIVTKEGWIRLRTSILRIQPSKAAAPMQNASSAKAIDIDLLCASCCFETGSGLVKRVTGSGRSDVLVCIFQFGGPHESLYWLVIVRQAMVLPALLD